MSFDLWPPDAYPTITPAEPTVSGCTLDVFTDGLSEMTANTPAEAAVTTRLIRPLFVKGRAGILRWSVTVTPLGGIELDVQAQILFLDDDDAQVGRWLGPQWHIDAGIVLSARETVPRLATQAQLKVLSTSDTNAGEWTELDSRLDQQPIDLPYTPPVYDPEFGTMSDNGVMPPAPPAGLPGLEANSPARRSPQVRWAQVNDSTRPDLVGKKNAREV